MTRLDNITNSQSYIGDGTIGWDESKSDSSWGSPPDRFLAINGSKDVELFNHSSFILDYNFFLSSEDCSRESFRGQRVYFNTSTPSGLMPDLTTVGECPSSVGAITIETQANTSKTCQLSSPQPEAIPCDFAVDQAVYDQIAKRMADFTGCSNVTWPTSTGIGTTCGISLSKGKSGSNSSKGIQAALTGSAIAFAGLISLALN
ncbi:hypothetical protein EJ08DRAFT_709699 [Tothia fuscella]|uniref:Uncharacterized protein n=1 Tax=Tothia fuscella TaxID=1048955 RepID=A0A9P4TSG9_9PEZI|nr:hypothetical protein EJ08DRAFT_709699 [Tothia fuscella]